MGVTNGDFVWVQVDADNNLAALPSSIPRATDFSYQGNDGSALVSGRASEPHVNDIITIGEDGSALVGIKLENDTPGDFWYFDNTSNVGDVHVERFSNPHNEYIRYPCVTHENLVGGRNPVVDVDQFNDDKLWIWGEFGFDGTDGTTKYYAWADGTDGTSEWDGTVIDWSPDTLPNPAWCLALKWDGRYGKKEAVVRDWWVPSGLPGTEDGSWDWSTSIDRRPASFEYDKNVGGNGTGYAWMRLGTSSIGGGDRFYVAILRRLAENKWKYEYIFDTAVWTEPSQTNYIQNLYQGVYWKNNTYSLMALESGNPQVTALYKNDGSISGWDNTGDPNEFVKTKRYLWMYRKDRPRAWRYDGNVVEEFDTATMPGDFGHLGKMVYDEDNDYLYYLIADSTIVDYRNKLYRFQDDGTDDGTFKLHKNQMVYDYTWTGKWSRTDPTLWNTIPNVSQNIFTRSPLLYSGSTTDRSIIDNEAGKDSMIYFGDDFSTAERVEQLTFFNSSSSRVGNDGSDIFFSFSWNDTQNWSLGNSCDSIGDVFLNITQSGATYTCSVYASESDRDGTQNRVCYVQYTATGNTPMIDDNYDIDGTVRIRTLATDNDIIVSVPVVAWQPWPREQLTIVQGEDVTRYKAGQLENPITFIMSRTEFPRP